MSSRNRQLMMRNKVKRFISSEASPSKGGCWGWVRVASIGIGILFVTTMPSFLGSPSLWVSMGIVLQLLGVLPMRRRWWLLSLPILVLLGCAGWWVPLWTMTADQCCLYGAALGGPLTVFALSLRPGQTPLLTQMAEGVHGPLRRDVQVYTTCLTWGWVGFFVLALVAPVFLWALAPRHHWWHYPLGGGALGVALCLFFAELPVRRLFIRHFEHATLGQNMRAGYMVFMKKH